MTTNTNSAQERTASIDLAQLDKLEALANAATPGPWMRLFGERTVYDRMEDGCRGNTIVRADVGYSSLDADNLDFIAAANPATMQQLIALARRSLTSGTPAEPAPSTVETEMADRLRRIVANHPGATIPVSPKTLAKAADECDRFYNGMMNWKANAQAKDRTIIDLREASAGAAAKTEQDRRILLDTIGDLGEALLKARDWLSGNAEAISYINKSIALAGIRPAATAAGAGSAQPEALNEIFAAIDEAQRMNRYNESSFEIASRVARLKCLADNYRAAMRANDGAAEEGTK